MADKPGVTTFPQLDQVMRVQRETGRIYSVNFTERFEVRAVTRAMELVRRGRDRRRRADGRARSAPPQSRAARSVVLRSQQVRRDPGRHRIAPDRPVPAFHRRGRRADRASRVQATSRIPTIPASRTSARSCSRTGARAATSASTGSRRTDCRPGGRPAVHHRHARLDRTAQVRRHRRPTGHRPSVPRRRHGRSTHRLQRREASVLREPAAGHRRANARPRCRRRTASRYASSR